MCSENPEIYQPVMSRFWSIQVHNISCYTEKKSQMKVKLFASILQIYLPSSQMYLKIVFEVLLVTVSRHSYS